ncbi:hypothetical protein DRN52_03025 [Thermococci archaeon]|nr:MAG: hypothetical protein DRN52_03025 [Thermococci archaeon]
MPKKCSLDTGFITLYLTGELPEKWTRVANGISKGRTTGLVPEGVVSETYYQLLKDHRKEEVERMIMKLKGIQGIRLVEINNRIAILGITTLDSGNLDCP